VKLLLTRKTLTEHSTIGDLSVDGVFFGYSLELPWRDNQHDISCVPEGTYPVKMIDSGHWKRTVPHLLKVPGRDLIEIHIANYPKDIKGCIGVGYTKAPDFIGLSAPAIGKLFKMIEDCEARKEDVTIEIKKEVA
jgi:hypothetical protein